jgi:lipoate-protein ligase A
MSPSRGLLHPIRRFHTTHPFPTLLASNLSTQIYISTSTNPHLNLSLEHHLFLTLPATTRTLLLYTNTPSVILGRNQNPWIETNHPLLLRRRRRHEDDTQLLRRRSGGGTVYHDLGNVNYSVTVPTSEFNRDTHAKLLVRAMRKRLRVERATVNARHDVVLLPETAEVPGGGRGGRRVEKMEGETPDGTRKVSGSAYKLTRLRSYHHGTMLLNSDLTRVSELLRSPAGGVITANGVPSVSSPVANVGVRKEEFVDAVVEEFLEFYGQQGEAGVSVVGEDEARKLEGVAKGIQELVSEEWTYAQTPRFTVKLPGRGGEVEVERGVVTKAAVDEVVSQRFGGSVVKKILKDVGEDETWAERMIGGTAWGRN